MAEPTITTVDALLKARGRTHGSFEIHAAVTQQLKGVINQHMLCQGRRLDVDMQEALDMVCHKIGRIVAGDPKHHDHWFDIAGYVILVADRLERHDRDPF